MELSKLQEATRQQEQLAKIKEYEAAIEQSKVEQKKVDYEERRKTLQVGWITQFSSCLLFTLFCTDFSIKVFSNKAVGSFASFSAYI